MTGADIRSGAVARPRFLTILATIATGAAAGALARLLANVLAPEWATLANTSALWGLVPFGIVLVLRERGWRAAAYGVLGLSSMIGVWIASAPVATARELVLWSVAGLAAGAVCGLAASGVRSASRFRRIASAAGVAGLVAGEGLYGILLIGGPQWILELVIGFGLAVGIGVAVTPGRRVSDSGGSDRGASDRMLALAATALVAVACVGAYFGYDAVAVL